MANITTRIYFLLCVCSFFVVLSTYIASNRPRVQLKELLGQRDAGVVRIQLHTFNDHKFKSDDSEDPSILADDPAVPSYLHQSLIDTLPHGSAFKPAGVLAGQQWLGELRELLLVRRKSKLVTLTTSTWGCAPQLVQWLVSARLMADPPLDNILVLSYDPMVHNMLIRKSFSSIQLNVSDIFQEPTSSIKNGILLSRLLVVRIINSWGISVFHCDTDALLLKNPFALFEHGDFSRADIVASRGRYPFELGENGPWNHTACMGAILFRSTPRTELFWRAVRHLNSASFDDQFRVNYAMEVLNITWASDMWTDTAPNFATGDGGFKVVILPPAAVCRETCRTVYQERYYVWHSKKKLHFKSAFQGVVQAAPAAANDSDLIGDGWLRRRSSWVVMSHNLCDA